MTEASQLPTNPFVWNHLIPKRAVGSSVQRAADGSLRYLHPDQGLAPDRGEAPGGAGPVKVTLTVERLAGRDCVVIASPDDPSICLIITPRDPEYAALAARAISMDDPA